MAIVRYCAVSPDAAAKLAGNTDVRIIPASAAATR